MHPPINLLRTISALILILICCGGSVSTAGVWSHSLLYLEKNVTLSWNNTDAQWFVLEMSAPVSGYVAIGFSPNGGMPGSDIVFGWVDSTGTPRLFDGYAEGYSIPSLNETQNYELISGTEVEGRTTIRFRRKWNTCDLERDMNIGNGTIRLIWAMHEEDPVMDGGGSLGTFLPKYHHENRGVRRVYIRNRSGHIPFPDDEEDPTVKHWDVHMDNNLIDKEDDIYFCKIAKFPKMEKKHHLIGYRPLLQPGNEFAIHHIIMYECLVPAHSTGVNGTEDVFEKWVGHPGGRCYTPNMPPEWGTYCTTIPIIWTSGSEGNMFAPNTGNPLGEQHGGTTYFMFEVHYDNPRLRSFLDSSGFRLFYTDKLRQFDSSSFLVGQKVSPFHVVPPQMDSFTSFGYCTAECTAQTIPPEGILVTSVLLHAHLAGKKIILRHLRGGKELPPIAMESNYDYNYQQARGLEPPVRLLPGDELITECEYNTTFKSKPSFGGLGTQDEMCMSFIYYYPKIELTECKTQTEFHSFLQGLSIDKVEGEILKELKMPYVPKDDQVVDYGDAPFYLKNSSYEQPLNALDVLRIVDVDGASKAETVGALIRSTNWLQQGKQIEQRWNEGAQYAFCTGPVKKRVPLKEYVVKLPKYEAYKEPKEETCLARTSTSSFQEEEEIGYQNSLIVQPIASPTTFNLGQRVPRPSLEYPTTVI